LYWTLSYNFRSFSADSPAAKSVVYDHHHTSSAAGRPSGTAPISSIDAGRRRRDTTDVTPPIEAAARLSLPEETVMSDPTRPYEPLTSENAALVLIDHQVGLMTGVRDYSIAELKHNLVGLAKAAKALRLPIVVTTTARDSMWGPTVPELVEALPGVQIIDRSSVNAFDDSRVSRAIEATGRGKLIFAGLSLEVCAAFPAMTAVGKGLDAYVAVDACGTFSATKRQVGLMRMMQAGVIPSDYATLMIEILKDNARPEAGAVYGALDMDWAKLVGQVVQANAK
jgi:nicotinamidase-related amidase